MTIGQITISAADWLASRVSDRIALVVAGQKTDLSQQAGGKAVAPVEENIGAQLDRRERERSLLAAQESYKRVAQRIKSRLTNPLPPAQEQPAQPKTAAERAIFVESLRKSPKLAATVIAAEQKAETSSGTNARPDALFGLTEPDLKKAGDRQAASVDEKEKEANEDGTRKPRERGLTGLTDEAAVFRSGIWDDLFFDRGRPDDS
ncbi:hypothetical protein [Pelagibacterium limicola]|uniref:hypothetical protein n=1 Tax=Pelagibacterium limicola TaxID=2791022 RepID=UPI0018AFCB74|nr:hypothetical protein [Pelagibacterium limicola]